MLGFLILTTVTVLYEWRKRKAGHEQMVISKNIKLATAALVLVGVIFYIGFASQYKPEIVIPTQAVIQSIVGWSSADRVSITSVTKIAVSAVLRRQYLNAPMTPSFWNATVNDFGFEKPTQSNNVDERHHIRIWKTNLTQYGLSVYVGTASLDTAFVDPVLGTNFSNDAFFTNGKLYILKLNQ